MGFSSNTHNTISGLHAFRYLLYSRFDSSCPKNLLDFQRLAFTDRVTLNCGRVFH